jgi:Trp operon repressor
LFELTLLTAEERELLSRAASLMEELLETLEIMQDRELVKDLKVALREVKEGKTRPFNELLRELNLEEEI